MSKCQNCGATMSCGCQKRVTPDGKVGCSKCINALRPITTAKPANSKP